MAGAGYKLFGAGDILTAGQVNTYLNEQSVMVFATTAARDAALTSVLAEGMVCYVEDLVGGVAGMCAYDGSAWQILWSEWVDYTPTFDTGVTVGDGTYQVARYAYVAPRQYKLEILFLLGSTSAITGQVELAMPIQIANGRASGSLHVTLYNAGTAYPGVMGSKNTSASSVQAVSAAGTYAVRAALSATVPFTWGSGDRISIYGTVSTS